MAVRAPADKRFRRAQLRPARRRRSWRPVWSRIVRSSLVLMLVLYAGYRATDLILNASALAIDRFEIRGNERLSTGEVLALVAGLQGENILTADLEAWRRRLMRSPWVKDAALRKVVPSTIVVVVSERMPVALGRVSGRLYLVDGRGTFIDEYGPQHTEFDLPIIDGLASAESDGRPTIDSRRAQLAVRLIEDVSRIPRLARRISQIDVRAPYDAVIILDGDPALLHVGTDQFLDRLQSYVEMASALRARVPEIDYVDLRFGERVYVRPAGADHRASDRP